MYICLSLSLSIYIYIYIYMYTHMQILCMIVEIHTRASGVVLRDHGQL